MRAWLLAHLHGVLAFAVGSWLELTHPHVYRTVGDRKVSQFSLDPASLGMAAAQLPAAAAGPGAAGHRRIMRTEFFIPATGSAVPLLLYFPGWPGTRADNPRLLQDLASHGFCVVQVRIVQEDPRLTGEMDLSTDTAVKATLWKADAKVRLQAQDAVALLDALQRLATGSDPRFARIDTSRVGILGFSFGGAIATQAASTDRRFRAVLNMDGWLFGPGAELDFPQSYFLMSDDEADPTAAELASPDAATRESARLTEHDLRRIRGRLQRPDAIMMIIEGTGHESFSDTPAHFSLRGHSLPGPVQSLRISALIRRYAEAYFARELTGKASELLAEPRSPYPEVRLTFSP